MKGYQIANARCVICGTDIDGRYKIGEYYYCPAHYSQNTVEERNTNRRLQEQRNKMNKYLDVNING